MVVKGVLSSYAPSHAGRNSSLKFQGFKLLSSRVRAQEKTRLKKQVLRAPKNRRLECDWKKHFWENAAYSCALFRTNKTCRILNANAKNLKYTKFSLVLHMSILPTT